MSPLHALLARLAQLPTAAAHVALDLLLDSFSTIELAAANYDYSLWARPDQFIAEGDWRSKSIVAGRGWGKDWACGMFVISEIVAGRARRIALVGQSEQKTIEILVTGETGLLALCPPWLKAEYEISSNLIRFSNGAIATIYTAAEPIGLRGPQHDLAVATEIAAWHASTREEAMSNMLLGLRLGRGQLLANSTPRRRNPLIRERLALSAKDPTKHEVIFGRTEDNEINLAPGVVAEWREQWGGTAKGAEELDGRYFDDVEDALFKQAWIDKTRRKMPEKLSRRIIVIDPAITDNPRYSDATGIMDMGLGVDGQVYAIANHSGVHRVEAWPGMVVDMYVRGDCDLILVETNRGGTAWSALLRTATRDRGLVLQELGPLEVPGRRPGVVNMRAINAKRSKTVRASGAAALLEKGRVSLIEGELGDLEDRLCSFDGSEKGPDDAVDTFVHGCHELAGLAHDAPDLRAGFKGIAEINAKIAQPTAPGNISRLLGPKGGGGWRF